MEKWGYIEEVSKSDGRATVGALVITFDGDNEKVRHKKAHDWRHGQT
jgi:hypothetical protein